MPEKFSAFKKSTIIIIILKPYRKNLKNKTIQLRDLCKCTDTRAGANFRGEEITLKN